MAHVSLIPLEAAEFAAARALEGRWRGQLGDLAGASLAYAQLRERAASRTPGTGDRPRQADGDVPGESLVEWLVEAAAFEERVRGDLLAAQRHLAVAMRLDPHHGAAGDAFRAVGLARVGGDAEAPRHRPVERIEVPDEDAPEAPRNLGDALAPMSIDPFGSADDEDSEKAARVEELTRRLHADPANDAVANELAVLLEALGRHHELLALLSARLEDASPAQRPMLLPQFCEALERLARGAESAGRTDEASLYRSVLSATDR